MPQQSFLMRKNGCLKSISQLKNVPGRFQTHQTSNGIMLIIDYAHTPDAKNVLNTINKIRTQNENLFTIVGCGGNRDKEKTIDGGTAQV